MSITAYTMLVASTSDALNTLVAAAIANSQQPYGAPFARVNPHGDAEFCQAVIAGSQVLVGATGATGAAGAAGAAASAMTVRHAAGVPTGAPTGSEGPVAIDSTAVSGGLYVWTGAAWVQGSTIP